MGRVCGEKRFVCVCLDVYLSNLWIEVPYRNLKIETAWSLIFGLKFTFLYIRILIIFSKSIVKKKKNKKHKAKNKVVNINSTHIIAVKHWFSKWFRPFYQTYIHKFVPKGF